MVYLKSVYFIYICAFILSYLGCKSDKIEDKLIVSPLSAIQYKSLDVKPSVIYRSEDLGNTWVSYANGIPTDATLSSIKQQGQKVYVATDYHGIFVDTHCQNEWKPILISNFKDLDINCIEIKDSTIVVGTLQQGVLFSDDAGSTWNKAINNIDYPVRAFMQLQNKLLAGSDAGIFESTDLGKTWTHIFGNIQILGFTKLNNKIYAATQNGVLMYTNNTSSWSSIYEDDALHDIGNDGYNIYAMTISQQLLKTNDDGQVWHNVQNGIMYPDNFYTNEIVTIGQHIFSAQWIGIYHSLDYGNNWRILSGLPDSTAFSTIESTNCGIIAGISIR